jgi:RNA polymerase sigma factor (sigma-70 family)
MEKEPLTKLVTNAQNGDSAAMDQLFAAFYNDVYYFALKTVKDSDLACDITQETFLEIIHTIGNLKEPAAFVTWMKQITYHQCTRYFKKKKEVLVEEDEDGNTIFDTLADENEGSIPSEVYEKEEFRNTILGIINELTEYMMIGISGLGIQERKIWNKLTLLLKMTLVTLQRSK